MKKKTLANLYRSRVLVFIGVSALLSEVPAEHIRETKKNVKTGKTHKTKATDKKDSHDVLTDKEYKANKETDLAAANIGLYVNQDNKLVGTLTFVEGKVKL